ncbi:MAG: prephenate dehydrogenase/arogenate dehydrogenase family protein [Chlorobi bacterium]|nr:prephenate dehydrogenase/arogenate dehydrogenase family protein [Chlorobiota bacterium]
MQPVIRTISFVGLGLIGASMMLAFRKAHSDDDSPLFMKGYDPLFSEEERQEALDSGLDRFETDKTELYDADLIILSAPVKVNIALLDEIKALAGSSVLVTDVSSTKSMIAEKARDLCIPFIGMHPMAGRELQGFRAASAELLRGKTLILCDNGNFLDEPKGRALSALLAAVGCRTMVMDPAMHDRIVANISHLPQLISTLLVNYCEKNIAAAGPGFATLARLSGSSWEIWNDIVQTNSTNIADELERFATELNVLADEVRSLDTQTLSSRFSNANRLYQTLKELHKQ